MKGGSSEKELSSFDSIVIPRNMYGVRTPLRYPGGKSVLTGFFASLITRCDKKITTYIEPYAGGAGAAISLLENGIVEKIVINDFDTAVCCFWKSLIINTDKLIKKIEKTEISIDEWKNQREIYKKMNPGNTVELGFSFFYLNRTNRSGIATGGVIGGLLQDGSYKLDARFNKETLINKIKAIAKLKKQITVLNLDGSAVFMKYAKKSNCFIYLDPPYVAQGKKLYFNSFSEKEHEKLSSAVKTKSQTNWIMTYDENDLIKKLYSEMPIYRYVLNYSAQNKRKANELLICSPLIMTAVEALAFEHGVEP